MQFVRTLPVGDVLLIEIHNPPVNEASLGVRQGLLDAIGQLAADPALRAGVLIGAGGSFVAGADLREFGQPLQDPQLPDVLAAIEACAKPVVAALHGAALGGGLELALACDARIAVVGTVLGLPEVTLGVIPGAGGTQRLPRRTGLARAISLIGSGERLPAEEARELGLLDAVVADGLPAHAVALAQRLQGRRPRARCRPWPSSAPAPWAPASPSRRSTPGWRCCCWSRMPRRWSAAASGCSRTTRAA